MAARDVRLTVMQPLKVYDYLTITRQKLLDSVRSLSAEQYAQAFPIGLGSLGRILTHIMTSEWYYVQRLQQLHVPDYDTWPIRDDAPPAFAELEKHWREQARQTVAALSQVRDWDAPLVYVVTNDDGRQVKVTTTAGDLFVQLTLHEVHHRAQVMNILRHFGIAAEDLDYNALMYKREVIAADSTQ